MNPNVYQDKITDQKFFNRNFKLKSTPDTTSKDIATTTNNGITSSATSNNSMNTVDLIERNYTSLGMCEILSLSLSLFLNNVSIMSLDRSLSTCVFEIVSFNKL